MAEDRVVLTADANQYFDVLSRAGAAANRFATSGTDIGNGFLRSERTIGRATSEITRNLLLAGDAGQALDSVLLGLLRVGILPLGAGAAIGAAVGGVYALHKAFKETEKAADALTKELAKPLIFEISLSPTDIEARIKEVTKATDVLAKQSRSIGQKTLDFLFPAGSAGAILIGVKSQETLQRQITEGIKRQKDDSIALAGAELNLAELKQIQVIRGKEVAAAAKADLDFETARAKLFETAFQKPGTDITVLAGRFIALQKERDLQKEIVNLELQKENIEVRSAGIENAIQATAARAEIGAGPERQQRIQLEAQVAAADERMRAAIEFQDLEGVTAVNEKALEGAITAQAVAKANLAKFENQTAFNNQQALRSATAETEEVAAEVGGQKFLADIIKERATAEAKIAGLLRDQKTELAEQAQIQATLRFNAAVGGQLLRTPEQITADQTAQRQAQFQETVGQSFLDMLRQDVAAGAKLDEAQQKILNNANALRDAVPKESDFTSLKDLGGSDFSSLHSLADSDFSGVGSLADMDFSGLAPLDGLTISIA